MQIEKTLTQYGNVVYRTLNGHLVARTCAKCKLILPASNFAFNKTRNTHRPRCSSCVIKEIREKGYERKTPYERRVKTNNAWKKKNQSRDEKEIRDIQKIKYPNGDKLCPKCGETKPLSQFYRHRSSIDGLQYRCKTCHNALVRK